MISLLNRRRGVLCTLALTGMFAGGLYPDVDDGAVSAEGTTGSDGSATTDAMVGTGGSATTEASGPSAGRPVEGCENALSDITDNSADDPPGRCEVGYPEPVPLAERTPIRIAVSNASSEFFSDIILGIHQGEYERENLDVELLVLPPADSLQLLANGEIDATSSAPHAGVVNAIAGGFEVRWVAGALRQPADLESGLWVPNGWTVQDLPGTTVASGVGLGSNGFLPLYEEAVEAGIDLRDIEFTSMPDHQEVATALLNGGIDAGYTSPPSTVAVEEDGRFEFLVPFNTTGETTGGILFGPTLLNDREVGEAFMRAYVRTISTYFAGDYKEDAEVVAGLSEALEIPEDTIRASGGSIRDYEIHMTTFDRLQGMYFATDTLELSEAEALDETDIVDRAFLEAAIGATYAS